MKIKKIFMVVIALLLVACTAVGGTLAYLSAKDDIVAKNTFTFANDIIVELKETDPTEDDLMGEATAEGTEDTGWSYNNVVPGQTLPKQPKVSVNSTVETYVFVKVSGLSENVRLTDSGNITSNGWLLLDVAGNDGSSANGIYYRKVNANDDEFKNIFDKVTIGDNVTEEVINDEVITIAVTAIQASEFDSAEKAFEKSPEFATVQ